MKNFKKQINGYELVFEVDEKIDKALEVKVTIPPKRPEDRGCMWIHQDLRKIILEESKLELVSADDYYDATYALPRKTCSITFTFEKAGPILKKSTTKTKRTKKNTTKK